MAVLPMLGIIGSMLLWRNSSTAVLFIEGALPVLSWIPVLNPIYTLGFIKAYRRSVLASLTWLLSRCAPSEKVLPVST